MKKLLCWLTVLALLVCCAGGLAETADGNEKTAFLQITGSAPVPVYREITDTEKADELQPGQLCGLVDDVTTETGIRWYQIIYLNAAKKGAVGYIRPEYAHRLTLAEFNALAQDPAKANEAMDLLDAVNASLKSGSGSVAAAAGAGNAAAGGDKSSGTEGEKSAQAGTDLFREFYTSAMKALDQVFNMDVTGAIGDAAARARDIAGKAVGAGLDILGSALGGVKGLVTDLTGDAEKKIAGAAPDLEKKLGEVLETAGDRIGKVGEKAKERIGGIADAAGDGLGKIGDRAKDAVGGIVDAAGDGLGKIGDQAKDAVGGIADAAKDELGKIGDQAKDAVGGIADAAKDGIGKAWDTAGELAGQATDGLSQVLDTTREVVGEAGEKIQQEIADKAPVIASDFTELLAALRDSISGVKETAGETLEDWVDDINALFPEDAERNPEQPISESLEAKLAVLQDNLTRSTADVSAALRSATQKIEEGGLLEFASRLLNTLSQNDPDAWADFWKSDD